MVYSMGATTFLRVIRNGSPFFVRETARLFIYNETAKPFIYNETAVKLLGISIYLYIF